MKRTKYNFHALMLYLISSFSNLKEHLIVRQVGGKKPPHRGTIPFWLYTVPIDLVSVFLDVGNLQIFYKDLLTRKNGANSLGTSPKIRFQTLITPQEFGKPR